MKKFAAMKNQLFAILCGVAVGLASTVSVSGQTSSRNFVQLEVISKSGGSVDQNQRWLEALSEVGADNIRLGQTVGSPKANIVKTKTRAGNSYKIVGFINRSNQLVLPGGRFSIGNTAGIKAYIDGIRADGAEVALAEKVAFGLTAAQLVNVHDMLKPPFEDPTVGMTPVDVVNKIKGSVAIPFVIDPSAKDILSSSYQLQDDFQGISCGTTLAAALRPLGLVAAPQREAGKAPFIVITDARRVEEHWPIGWPLKVRPSQAVPKLMTRIPVNIRNYTMKATLPAIQKGLGVPFLYDYNSMEMKSVDLEKIRINVQAEKLSYQLILRRVVSQARPGMQMEVRADEAGNAFVWFNAR